MFAINFKRYDLPVPAHPQDRGQLRRFSKNPGQLRPREILKPVSCDPANCDQEKQREHPFLLIRVYKLIHPNFDTNNWGGMKWSGMIWIAYHPRHGYHPLQWAVSVRLQVETDSVAVFLDR